MRWYDVFALVGPRRPRTRAFAIRGAKVCLGVIINIFLLSSPAYAEEPKPDAMLSLTQTSVGLFFGYTWGSGVLAYRGETYPVEIGGFSIFSFGFTQAKATGKVSNLKRLEDFNGTYIAASAEGAVWAGAGAASMKNENAVVIHLFTTTAGLKAQAGPEELRLNLK